MKFFLLLAAAAFVAALLWEARDNRRNRRMLQHVVHVNGTRGKSTVTRLIAAGLAGGDHRVFCKTTGTLPMTIDPEGNETILRRRGPANISEQITTLRKAARSGADTLVIECMAVDPELQAVCEHRILRSDVGVITNVRIDHVAEMGDDLPSVCQALSNTIPEQGVLFTAEDVCCSRLADNAALLGTEAIRTIPDAELSLRTDIDPFPENIALALAVCHRLGVDRESALAGMSRVVPDPYRVSEHVLPAGARFVNAMSANDPASTRMIWERIFPRDCRPELPEDSRDKRIVLLNCRSDRGYRTQLMIGLLPELQPEEVWLLGGGRAAAGILLKRKIKGKITSFARAEQLPLEQLLPGTTVFAIGNIAGPGLDLMERVRQTENAEKGEADGCTEK